MDFTRRQLNLGVAAFGIAATGALRTGAVSAAQVKPGPGKVHDAIILGAGVSGLNAAWLLEQQGLSVMVLEARQRVGGRVLTLFDQPGYPEMGFNAMGAGYGRGIDAAKRAGVELVDIGGRTRGTGGGQELVLGGKIIPRETWATSPLNPLPEGLKTLMPWEVAGRLIAQHNPLKDWSAWMDTASAPLDISVNMFLKAHGLNDAAIQLAFDTAPYYGSSSFDVSALMFEFNDAWGKVQSDAGPGSFAVKGGNQKLPMGMAKLLKGDVLLGKEVTGIASEADVATVLCADGSRHRARRIVCSLPFSTLRDVKIEPGLQGDQARAVQILSYQPLSIAFVTVAAPYWDRDRLSPAMWTDGLLGSVVPQRFGATPDQVTGLMVQARGRLARLWDRMGREAVLEMVVAELERIRPASKGLVKATALHSWAGERFNAGDWAYFAPGQLTGFVRDMAAPAGRLHFCGEHTATANRGLEGALESSERVALEILSS